MSFVMNILLGFLLKFFFFTFIFCIFELFQIFIKKHNIMAKLTEEEKKERHRECVRKWNEKNKDKILESSRKWKKNNSEKAKESQNKSMKKLLEENPDYWKEQYQKNKDKKLKQAKQYQHTPIGRAYVLLNAYRQSDKKENRGECTLTAQWIIDNIFSKPCIYCGETGWEIMGCDRINNDLPHTPDNVVPCCSKCNKKRGITDFEEFLKANEAHI